MVDQIKVNARNIMEYVLPQSIDEALSILNSHPNPAVYAGATDIIPQLRGGRPEPGLLVDLKNIPSLVDLGFSNGTWYAMYTKGGFNFIRETAKSHPVSVFTMSVGIRWGCSSSG